MKHLGGKGFTIIETLIVLTVTAAMFVVAILAFAGQQERTRFSQATRDTESKIQDVANDITAGYFPEVDGWACRQGLAGPVVSTTIADSTQGTNEECIFVGKAIQFGSDQDCASSECGDMRIVTVVGNRLVLPPPADNPNKEVTTLAETKQVSTPVGSPYEEDYRLQFGLGVTKIFDQDGAELSGLAFFSSLGAAQTGDDVVTGSQATRLYAMRAGSLGMGDDAFNTNVSSITDADRIQEATVCLTLETNGRPSAIIFNDQSGGLSSELLVDNRVEALCA